VSAAVEVSTTFPLTKVVAVVVYVPGQVLFGTRYGNVTVFCVFAGSVNGGVVNMTVLFVLLQLSDGSGPVQVN
jgi:hypothetical protein